MKPQQSRPVAPREVKTIYIKDIAMSDALQLRNVDYKRMREYGRAYGAGAVFPPVEIIKDRTNGALILCDGWHRIAALKDRGRFTVEAHIKDGTLQEAMAAAAVANMTHGRGLTPAQKRKAFALYMKAKGYLKGTWGAVKSFEEIGVDFGGGSSRYTIRRWMKEGPYKGVYEKHYKKEGAMMKKDAGEFDLKEYQAKLRMQHSKLAASALGSAFMEYMLVTSKEARGRLIEFTKETLRKMEAVDHTPYKVQAPVEEDANDDF